MRMEEILNYKYTDETCAVIECRNGGSIIAYVTGVNISNGQIDLGPNACYGKYMPDEVKKLVEDYFSK